MVPHRPRVATSANEAAPLTNTDLQIVDFEPRHASAFGELNYAWIKRYFVIEPSDRKVLDNPIDSIIAPGGHILMALVDDKPVGTCALLHHAPGEFELAKMAVDERRQGLGIGGALGEAAVNRAREHGAVRIVLESNRKLAPALALYRRLGFREIAADASVYTRCDVQMALEMSTTSTPFQNAT